MQETPYVVVFYETPSSSLIDAGGLLLHLAGAAWRYQRLTTLLVDADPAARLTRAARAFRPAFRPARGSEPTFDDHLLAAAMLEPPPEIDPWRLSRQARSLVPAGVDPLHAHAQALAAVAASGGVLDIGARVARLLRPDELKVHLTLVLAPSPSGGLGQLLGAQADLVVLLGDSLGAMGGAPLSAIGRTCRAAAPLGPTDVLPVLLPTDGNARSPTLPRGEPRRRPTLRLEGVGSPEQLLPLLHEIAHLSAI